MYNCIRYINICISAHHSRRGKENMKKNFNEMTEKEKLVYCMCFKHSGKMADMISLSTSCLTNPNCQKNRAVNGSICQHCYAAALLNMRKTQREKLEKATEFLTKTIINPDNIPFINASLFRFEAFGDLNNSIQVLNYFNIARKNPQTTFALWTKNPFIISYAMKEYEIEKPENMVIIISSLFVNKQLDFDKMKKIYPFIDKVFTVYDPDFIATNNIGINCGARHCAGCQNCYNLKNGLIYINEKLK